MTFPDAWGRELTIEECYHACYDILSRSFLGPLPSTTMTLSRVSCTSRSYYFELELNPAYLFMDRAPCVTVPEETEGELWCWF